MPMALEAISSSRMALNTLPVLHLSSRTITMRLTAPTHPKP